MLVLYAPHSFTMPVAYLWFDARESVDSGELKKNRLRNTGDFSFLYLICTYQIHDMLRCSVKTVRRILLQRFITVRFFFYPLYRKEMKKNENGICVSLFEVYETAQKLETSTSRHTQNTHNIQIAPCKISYLTTKSITNVYYSKSLLYTEH